MRKDVHYRVYRVNNGQDQREHLGLHASKHNALRSAKMFARGLPPDRAITVDVLTLKKPRNLRELLGLMETQARYCTWRRLAYVCGPKQPGDEPDVVICGSDHEWRKAVELLR